MAGFHAPEKIGTEVDKNSLIKAINLIVVIMVIIGIIRT